MVNGTAAINVEAVRSAYWGFGVADFQVFYVLERTECQLCWNI